MELTKSLSKISLLFLIICSTSSSLYSQNISFYSKAEAEYYKVHWFGDINVGTRLSGETSSAAELGPGFNGNVGLGYFFTERIGVKGRIDFNTLKLTPGVGEADNAVGYIYSFSLEAVTDLIALIYGTTSEPQFWRVVLHGGLGYSTYEGKDFKDNFAGVFTDPYFKGNDDMGHIILGLTPQYHLSTSLSINLDFSTFLLIKQDFTFDNYNGQRVDGLGNISTMSLGITFRPKF